MKRQKVIFLAVLATFLWGSAYPSIKAGYEIFQISGTDIGSKLLFAGFRFTTAGLMVLAYTKAKDRKACCPPKDMWIKLLGLGIMQTTVQYIFFYLGLANTTGAKSAILNSFTAFFPIMLAPFFFKEDKITGKKAVGCILGLIGIVVINLNGEDLSGFHMNGEGFALLAAMAQSIASIYSKKLSKSMSVMTITGYQLTLGGTLLILTGYVGKGHLSFSWQGAGLLLYMAGLSAVAFTVWTYLLSKNPVSRVAIYNLLIPIFGTALSGIFLGENIMTATHFISIAFVCSGIGIVNMKTAAAKDKIKKEQVSQS